MARLRPPLSVILLVAIAVGTLTFGLSTATQACPLTDGGLTDGGLSLNQILRQPDVGKRSDRALASVTSRLGDSNRPSLDYVELAGFGAIVGLFAIALLYKVRRSYAVAPAEAEFLSRYPQLEHPEMVLTLVPQEAWLSAFDTEVVAIR